MTNWEFIKRKSKQKDLEYAIDNMKEYESLCTWKKSYLENCTTFHDVNTEEHPLYPCTVCDDYTISSGCENYVSNTLIDLKKKGLINNFKWRF